MAKPREKRRRGENSLSHSSSSSPSSASSSSKCSEPSRELSLFQEKLVAIRTIPLVEESAEVVAKTLVVDRLMEKFFLKEEQASLPSSSPP